ncbi:hypothetical protein CYMTET_37543 [Cymbomonas tetramitiformis]|uniref:Uncharacterized protein n=1 Tax=Cymbomonas tetramitiformis TaxID=36881 RepID=A0AAE0F647_9CHLO|nr:hypothetical protein CYMTET_37543 [Cymbomonas tetramitiformis]
MLAPSLVTTRPLLLLLLNSNDLHLALTSSTTSQVHYYVVGGLRRCAEDPLYFLLGYIYGERAIQWILSNVHKGQQLLKSVQPWFRRGAPLCVLIYPNTVTSILAGASKLSPISFMLLTLLGTMARLIIIRGVGTFFAEWVNFLNDWVAEYQVLLTAATVCMGFIGALPMLLSSKKESSGD